MRECSRFDWVELIEGILLILLGFYSISHPGSAMTGVVLLYGLVAIVTGIADIVFYVKVEEHTGFGPTVSLVSGVLSVMAGVMLLIYPQAGMWILTLLIPIWFLAHCISRLCRLRYVRMMGWKTWYYSSLVINIIGIILGCLMIVRPWITVMSADWLICFYLILLGVDSIVLAVRH